VFFESFEVFLVDSDLLEIEMNAVIPMATEIAKIRKIIFFINSRL
jgi:hypothetical protein